MKISDSDIERVKEANDILDVVSCYLQLNRAGQNYKALCPFHQEKTASFMVNQQKQMYLCFGCSSGGDVFKFIMNYQRLDFPEAVKFLAEKAGIQLTLSDQYRKEEEKAELTYKALDNACSLYQKKFPNSIAENYIKRRRINNETIAQFRLGYAPDSWDFLFSQMKNHFETVTLEQAGLIIKRQSGDGYYDRFRGRLLFPIFNSTGRVVGFGARRLDDSDNSQPKYLNSPDGQLFSKGRLLYGMNFASKSAREKNQLIFVEGYTDVLNLHQAGIENTVGTIGTALTDGHIQMIEKRFPQLEELVLCFDNDEAGIKAALNAGEKTLGRVLTKVCLLPEGEDPASIIEKGEDFSAEFSKSMHFFDFYINKKKKGKNLETLEGKIAFLKDIKELYMKMPQNMHGLFAETTAQKTGISIKTIEQAFGKIFTAETQPYREIIYEKRIYWEKKFLAQLISSNSPETIRYFSELDEKIFCSREAQAIFAYLRNGSKQDIFNFGMPLFKKETLEKMVSEINTTAANQGNTLDREVLNSFFYAVQEQKDKLEDIDFSARMIVKQYILSIIGEAISNRVSYKELEKIIKGVRITNEKSDSIEKKDS